MRDLSDSLCRKYRLSVIEHPQQKDHITHNGMLKRNMNLLGEISLKKM